MAVLIDPEIFVLVVGNLPAGWAVEAEHSLTPAVPGRHFNFAENGEHASKAPRAWPPPGDTVPICSGKRRRLQGSCIISNSNLSTAWPMRLGSGLWP
jgi:hypothetical protein